MHNKLEEKLKLVINEDETLVKTHNNNMLQHKHNQLDETVNNIGKGS